MLSGERQVPAFGSGVGGQHIYDDTKQSATSSGMTLEHNECDWSLFYGDSPWVRWSNVRLNQDRSVYVTPDRKVLMTSTIRMASKCKFGGEHAWLHKMFTIPNSQVKNFLNACRGLYGNWKDEMSIAVVGSKAREGTGLWHQLFALYALTRSSLVYIDFYDSAEIANGQVISIDGKNAHCTWIPEFIDEQTTSEYDVVIDDAWLSGAVSTGFKIKAGSVKGREGQYEPFFASEGDSIFFV